MTIDNVDLVTANTCVKSMNSSTKSYLALFLPRQLKKKNLTLFPWAQDINLSFWKALIHLSIADCVRLDEGFAVQGALLPDNGQWLEERDWLPLRET